MTKNEYLAKYEKSFAYPGLHCAMVFHHDPILDVVEVRSIYSESRQEAYSWFETAINFYRKNQIDFIGYFDGIFEAARGDLNQYIKEEEDNG